MSYIPRMKTPGTAPSNRTQGRTVASSASSAAKPRTHGKSFGGPMLARPRVSDQHDSQMPFAPRQPSNVYAAGGGSARLSSFYGISRIGFKDPRPINDRNYQAEMAAKLHRYLLQQDYQHPVKEKDLQSLRRADLTSIFEFLMSTLCTDFKVTGSLDECMPRTLKGLGYPVELRASTLKCCSAPNSAGPILGALTWLVDLFEYMNDLEVTDVIAMNAVSGGDTHNPEADDFENKDVAKQKAIYEFNLNAYTKIRNDRAGYEEDADFLTDEIDLLRARFEELEGEDSSEALDREYNSLKAEIEKLKAERPADEEMAAGVRKARADLSEVREFTAGLNEWIERLDEELHSLQHKRTQMQSSMQALRTSIADRQHKIKLQPISGVEARELKSQRDELDRQVTQAREEMDALQDEKYALEKEISKITMKIEREFSAFVTKSRSLLSQLAAPTDDIDLATVSPLAPEFAAHVQQQLMPSMHKLNSLCRSLLHDAGDQAISIDQQMDEVRRQEAQLREQKDELTVQVAEIERQSEVTKKEYQQKMARDRQAVKELMAQYEQKRHEAFDDECHEKDAELRQLKAHFTSLREQFIAELRSQTRSVVSDDLHRATAVFDSVCVTQSAVKDAFHQFMAQMAEQCDQMEAALDAHFDQHQLM